MFISLKEILKVVFEFLPGIFQRRILIIRAPVRLKKLRREIIDYYSEKENEAKSAESGILKYLKGNPLTVFPYKFQDRYRPEDVIVYQDHNSGLRYVQWLGKSLYFMRGCSEQQIKKSYTELLKEQDLDSPHLYLTRNFDVKEGDVVVDIGAAEGNFSLSVIEKAGHVYLFEANEQWIEALERTFYQWRNKVTIVNKFISDQTGENQVKLDDYFLDREKINFIKIDAEGAEQMILNGAKRIISEPDNLKIALCTYHKQEDGIYFNDWLKGKGFTTVFSNGYMIFYYDKNIKPPFLRHGLIRAYK